MHRFQFRIHYLRTTAALVVLAGLAFAAESEIRYHLERTRPLSRFSSRQIALLEKLNRVDRAHLGGLGRVVVPDRWDLSELDYSPMPHTRADLSGDPKAVVVNIPAQAFGAYEYGTLVRWGPVSSGGPTNQTPPGRYRLHWNERVRISSVDSSWIMPWYYNFDDIIGLGFHQYSLPGRPASHGCVRMLQEDARWLFYWGKTGTRVLVNGEYNFASGRPWLRPGFAARNVSAEEPQAARAVAEP